MIGNQPGVSERIANHPWLSNPSENRTPQGVRALRPAPILAFAPFVVWNLASWALAKKGNPSPFKYVLKTQHLLVDVRTAQC